MKSSRVLGLIDPTDLPEPTAITDAHGSGLERKTNLLRDDMTILSNALTRAEAAESEAADLLAALSCVRVELLELERLSGAPDSGPVVAERADDLRRRLRGPLHDIAMSIRAALDVAEAAYFDGTVSGGIDRAHARTMIDVVLHGAREIRQLQLAINDTAEALREVHAEPAGDSRMPGPLSRSLQHASTWLERAQRGAHRTGEDLLTIRRSLSVDVAGLVGDRVESGAGCPTESRPVNGAELVRQTAGDVEDLRRCLADGHAELVAIESLTRRCGNALLVVDRTEDLRRSLGGQRREQAQDLRRALARAETLLLERATAGALEPVTARSMTVIALQAAREVRHLQLDLGHCADSLTPLAQSSPTGLLTSEASDGIEAATTTLDRARRSASRISEDFTLLARAIGANHERPVPLSLVLSDEIERLAPARSSDSRAAAVDRVSRASRDARPIGFDR